MTLPTPTTAFRVRFSLRARILLLVSGSVAAATFLVLATVLLIARREEEGIVRDSVRSVAVLTEQLLQERKQFLSTSVAVMSAQPTVVAQVLKDKSARLDWDTVSDVAQTAADGIEADALTLSDSDGHTLGEYDRSSATSSTRPDYAQEPGFADVMNQTRADKPWTGILVHNGRLTVVARGAIREPVSGYNRGILSAYAVVDAAQARMLSQAIRCDVAFVRKGIIFGSSRPLSVAPPRPVGERLTYVTLDDNKQYVAMFHDLDQQTAASGGIGVLVLYPYEKAAAFPRRIEAALIAPFALSLVVALFAGMGMARGLTQPLEGVVQAARTLQAGGWPERFGSDRPDEIGLLQNVFNEMTVSLKEARNRLLRLIDTDPLTELDNHRRFQERLTQEIERAAASEEPLSLLLLDLDRFHDYNLRGGHTAGDDALRRVAERLRETLPALAIPSRFGGEEFAVLLPRHTSAQAALVAQKMCDEIRAACELTVSIGYAELRRETPDAEGITLAAELAVAQAKQLGRDRICGVEALEQAGIGGTAESIHLFRFAKDGSLATIQTLAAAVDAKDPYTRGHSLRVAEIAARLARRIGLDAPQIDLLYTTGTLHDVGKIGIPDHILHKETRLDDEERKLIETHPVLGELIVGKAPQLADTLPGVRGHHERWDGQGYPDGLIGGEIPLSARILALADTFDAMTSDRPYRRGLPVARALDEITRNAGVQFDPALVPAFCEVICETTATAEILLAA